MTWDQDYSVERHIAAAYGPMPTPLRVSVYRDSECTDLLMVIVMMAGMDTLTVDEGCTLRFNEVGE